MTRDDALFKLADKHGATLVTHLVDPTNDDGPRVFYVWDSASDWFMDRMYVSKSRDPNDVREFIKGRKRNVQRSLFKAG